MDEDETTNPMPKELTLDKEATAALKHFIESVWLLRKTDKEILLNPFDPNLVVLRQKYQEEVDIALDQLVMKDEPSPQPSPQGEGGKGLKKF